MTAIKRRIDGSVVQENAAMQLMTLSLGVPFCQQRVIAIAIQFQGLLQDHPYLDESRKPDYTRKLESVSRLVLAVKSSRARGSWSVPGSQQNLGPKPTD